MSNAKAVSPKESFHQPGMTVSPTAPAAGPTPSASDGQKRCR
jgi:hypothetical protein